ncbi:MAG: family 78 glycoside hydrolase catalytic domain [Armatimonadetes bacterium]|nr:family 78 glycoside hydrolase catalytic domain [Armatimonadota bacterium]
MMRRRDFLKGSLAVGMGAIGITAAGGATRSSGRSASESTQEDGLISPVDLRCESLHDPLGIDAQRPRLSWKLIAAGSARNQFQSAYRIRVATTVALLAGETADLWDSGHVKSNRQLHIEYEGMPLKSGERCCWQVEVWDGAGRKSRPSPAVWWEMGLLSPLDWTGIWISDGKSLPINDEEFYEDDPAPLFRKSFPVEKPIKRARLYATALGYGEFRINGEALSDHALDPAWTSSEKRVLYTCHDVTERLSEGENVIGATLGNGWYNPLPLRMWGRINLREHLAVGRPQLLAQLIIEYQDGTSQVIASDGTWKVSDGPLLRNSVYLGEKYDARLEQPGWDKPGFDDSDWSNVTEAMSTPGALQSMPIPPIRVTKTLTPVSVNEVSDGVFIFDFGQNFAGWAALNVQGERGTTVHMRMGELLHADGTLNPMTSVAGQIKGPNVGGPGAPDIAWQENSYTLRGGGPEVYTPRFTFHGFRYVEVTGFPGTPDLTAIEGQRLNTDVEPVGVFSCSNERFNRIQEMVQWTFLSNLFSVQSDCPAREKYQYGGDIVASSEMAIYNYDMSTFYAKTVSDFKDAIRGEGWFTETAPYVGISAANYERGAGPIGWGLAHPLLVAQLYQYYGDRQIVEENYDAARTWVDLLERSSDGYIIDRCIGDHESLDPKPIALMATAQFCQAASLVAGFAELLGKSDRALHYRELASRIKSAFVEMFLERGTGRFGIATQAAQATALHLGLASDSEIEGAVERMVEALVVDHGGHVATGIFGTKYLLNALSTTGHSATAYRMVDQETYPGWGHMLENGATTLWETWIASDNTYSQNHPMFGSVSEWFFKCLGGIRPEHFAAGFDRFLIAPFVTDELSWVDVSYESVRGTVSSRWRVVDEHLQLDIEIPVNTEAVVQIPTSNGLSVREGGRPVAEISTIRPLPPTTPDTPRFTVGSGRYKFTAAAP